MKRLAAHWPEYLIEATCLALFMIAAAAAATVLQHPASPFAGWGTTSLLQRTPMGIAMGLTAVALIYSPLGAPVWRTHEPRRDAHVPAAGEDRAGGCGRLHRGAIRRWRRRHCRRDIGPSGDFPRHPSVNYVATVPGSAGSGIAFAAELLISFLMMSLVLGMSNTPRLARFTGMVRARSWPSTSSLKRRCRA